ncbi:MAG: hypothetical protein AB8B94_01810 [Hyphomicrobiales bacterium]
MFNHIDIPIERLETKAARISLSRHFEFSDSDQIQDWERHFEDFDRLAEFMALYETGQLDDDERFLLMELILASATNGEPNFLNSSLWESIKQKLRNDPKTHGWSIWFWACIDEDLRLPYNDFFIAPDLQLLLLDLAENVVDAKTSSNAHNELIPIQFGRFWQQHFGGHQPDSQKLRISMKDHWIRLHSFTGSKRYAENEAEGLDVANRTALLAQELLGKDAPCWFVANRYNNAPDFEKDVTDTFSMVPSLLWYDFEEPLEPGELVAHVTQCKWNVALFENVLYGLATGKDARLMWISQTDQTVFSAYDGGMDVILPDQEKALELVARFPDLILPARRSLPNSG